MYITKYYTTFFHQEHTELWICMEYCGAGSVSDILKLRKEPLNETQIAAILNDILKGLEYLHVRRRIHRDVKSGNILLTDYGDSKLADFGVSGQLTDTIAKRNTMTGTPFWMAPEVISSDKVNGYNCLADVWSLGITIVEMAELKPPLSDVHPMRAIMMIPTNPPPTFSNPQLFSQNFVDFLSHCLQKNPADRYSATKLLQHKFVEKAPTGSEVLLNVINECQEIRKHKKAKNQKTMNEHQATPSETVRMVNKKMDELNLQDHNKTMIHSGGSPGTNVMFHTGGDEFDNAENHFDTVNNGTVYQNYQENHFQNNQVNNQATHNTQKQDHNLPQTSNLDTNSVVDTDLEGTVCYYGSVVEHGTSVVTSNTHDNNTDGGQPAFMEYFDKEEKAYEASHLENLLTSGGNAAEKQIHDLIINGYTEADLKKKLNKQQIESMLAQLDSLMKKDLDAITERYNNRREPIKTALESKQNLGNGEDCNNYMNIQIE